MPAPKKPPLVQLSKLRMRKTLHAKLKREVERKGTDLTTEIVERLEKSFAPDEDTRRDSHILKMLLGFTSENDQMMQLLMHLLDQLKVVEENERVELVKRMTTLMIEIKKQMATTRTQQDE